MDFATASEEDDPIGSRDGVRLDAVESGGCPIENPAIEPIPGDPLVQPHPAEPGVHSDGTAAPLENPDDSVSADPLVAGR